MSHETVEIVRRPLEVAERSSRTLDQRLALRFPRLAAASARRMSRLSPSSRLRQAVVWRGVRLGVEAYNRRDLDAFVAGCRPDFEYRPAHEWVDAGLVEPSYRGREGYGRYVATTAEVWADEVHVRPIELIDLRDRFVLLADVPMRGQASGIPLTEPFALVATHDDGMVVRIQEYFDHAQALEAVGLSE